MTEAVDGPLDHLERVLPPWHTGPALTECGRPLSDVQSITTRDALKAKFAAQGKKRASFSTCMTCADLFGRAGTWEKRPEDVVERWVRGAAVRRHGQPTDEGARRQRELLALGMLVEEHREEFERLIEALGQTEDLDAARRRARMRAVRPGVRLV